MHHVRFSAAEGVVTAAACVALLLLAYGLRAGGVALEVAAILVASAALVSILQFKLSRVLLVVTCGAVFFTGLPQVYVGSLKVRLALTILATILAVATFGHGRRINLPWWILAPAGAIVLVTALVQLFPISADYLSSRLVDATFGPQSTADVGPAISSLLSVLGLPLAAVASSLAYRTGPTKIAASFVAGHGLSAFVAFTDHLGLTSLGSTLGGCGVAAGRACGFASHPVLLTIGTVYATGLAAWFLVRPSVRSRIFGAVSLPALVLGTYASGTRGGVLSIAFLMAASVLVLPQYRRYIHLVLLGTATAATVAFVMVPSFGHQILVTVRLVDSPSAANSDRGRLAAMSQGWDDFLHSPIYGIGLRVLFQAHNGYIQSLASGGLILLLGILVMQFGALTTSLRLMTSEAIAPALAATMLTRIGYEALEGALFDYAGIVPIALIAALLAQQRAARLVEGRQKDSWHLHAAHSPEFSPGGLRERPPGATVDTSGGFSR